MDVEGRICSLDSLNIEGRICSLDVEGRICQSFDSLLKLLVVVYLHTSLRFLDFLVEGVVEVEAEDPLLMIDRLELFDLIVCCKTIGVLYPKFILLQVVLKFEASVVKLRRFLTRESILHEVFVAILLG